MRGSAVLLLALLAAPAFADHVYTHRFVVSGRLLDEAGAPVANATVAATVAGVSSLRGDCKSRAGESLLASLGLEDANRSNGFGDFEVCVHVHALGARLRATVRAGNVTQSLPVDPGVRIAFAEVRGVEGNETPNDAWDSTLLVRARVWRPSATPLVLDDVPATGEAIPGRRVSIEVVPDDGGTGARSQGGSTDAYGDVAAYVPLGDSRSGSVRVATEGADPVIARYGNGTFRIDALLYLPPSDFARAVSPAPEAPRVVPAISLALALGAIALVVSARRGR